MVVAAGAIDGHGLEGMKGSGDHVIQLIHSLRHGHGFVFIDFGLDLIPGSGDEEAGGGDFLRVAGIE